MKLTLFCTIIWVQSLTSLGYSSENIISDPSQLETILNLSGRNISTVDSSMFGTPHKLTRLNLSSNSIVSFSKKSFKEVLQHLEILDLSHNRIEQFELDNLMELKLNDNLLKSVEVTQVKILSVESNRLEEIFIDKSMLDLNAAQNAIMDVKCDENMIIEKLNLSKNFIIIANHSMMCIKNAKTLLSLDLSFNPLGDLKRDIFAEIENLTFLDLSSSSIESLSSGLFIRNTKLKILNISRNNLHSIDYHMFLPLSSLETWDISSNNLTKLKKYEEFHELFPNLKTIGVHNNSFKSEISIKIQTSFYQQNISLIHEINDTNYKIIPVESKETRELRQTIPVKNIDLKNLEEKIDKKISVLYNDLNKLIEPKFSQKNSIDDSRAFYVGDLIIGAALFLMVIGFQLYIFVSLRRLRRTVENPLSSSSTRQLVPSFMSTADCPV